MSNILSLGLIGLFALCGALFIIGFAIYTTRTKMKRIEPGPTKDLDAKQADEVVSTWHLLNH